MSNRISSRTRAIAIRIPVEVYDTIVRKATKQGVKPSEWLRKRVVYDVQRVHTSKS